jgi:predicted naringenin-chalcone synthase
VTLNNRAAILGFGSAVPRLMPQPVSADLAADLCGDGNGQRAWLHRVYQRSGVEGRGSVLRVSDANDDGADMRAFYPPRMTPDDRGPTTGVRMQRYAFEAPPLAERASLAALNDAKLEAAAITHLITVSCTGFFAPGLDSALIPRLGLRPNVQRTHIGFMGCHAALNALNVANAIARSDADARILVCCIELCTLHFAYGWSPERIVANSLFGDAAVAVVVSQSNDPAHWKLSNSGSRLMPDSAAMMGWTIGNHGFEMTLSTQVPVAVRSSLNEWMQQWSGGDIAHWVIHPGGPKVIAAVGEAMNLCDEQMEASRRVLRRFGNVSSGTVLMILQSLGDVVGRCAMVAFGPGLMMEGIVVER